MEILLSNLMADQELLPIAFLAIKRGGDLGRRRRFLLMLSRILVLLGAGWLPIEAQCTAPACWPAKFYRLEVVAESGQTSAAGVLTGFGDQPSINEKGQVAFVGQIGSGGFEGVFEGTGAATPTWVSLGFTSSGRVFGRAVQINNANQIAARDRIPGSPPPTLVRTWNGNLPGLFTTIARGGLASDPFSSVLAQPGLNNSNQVVFSALDNSGNTVLATPNGALNPPFNQLPINGALRPQIEDTAGRVVVRAGATNSSPIVLYANTLAIATATTIADSTCFSALGQSPGISRDGIVVAFAGNMLAGPACATRWNTNPGPGIFVAILQGGAVFQIIRVAGFTNSAGRLGAKSVEDMAAFPPPAGTNWDGVCDPGETCTVAGELETQAVPMGPPSFAYFSTFDPAVFPTSSEWQERIGVIHSDFGAPGLDGDTIVVSFLATPNVSSNVGLFSANAGLWTVRADLRVLPALPPPPVPLSPNVHRPIAVIQVGDNLGSALETVTGIEVYDQIAIASTDDAGAPRVSTAGDHRVAFWVNTSLSRQKILRGSHLDSDGDGLLDHWEQLGIDFNGDGTIDLNVSALDPVVPGSPNHKDLYIEADYMCTGAIAGGACALSAGQHTHMPDLNPNNGNPLALPASALPTVAVTNAFRNAPVTNPDGVNGINLHVLVDEPITEISTVVWDATGANSFASLKSGTGPCGAGAGIGHFGTPADRTSPNCANIIGARRLVSRYTIFGHDYSFAATPGVPTGSSGVAKLRGDDFLVTLSAGANSAMPCVASADFADSAACLASAWGTSFDTEWAIYHGGTLMHEFGHTLGLFHGGNDLFDNYKPNYLSIMNYSFQFNDAAPPSFNMGVPADCKVVFGATQCRTNRPLDYSRVALPNLNKSALSEPAGVGGAAGRTLWYIPLMGGGVATVEGFVTGAIDWNLNSAIDALPFAQDLNISGCGSNPGCGLPANLGMLIGHEDWSTLKYSFLDSPEFGPGATVFTQQVPEVTHQDALKRGLGSPPPVTLSLMVAGTGTVLFSPGGVTCASSCLQHFSSGSVVTLTATPAAGFSFSGWSGACSGAGPCILTLAGTVVNVTATFSAGALASLTSVVPNSGQQGQTLTSVAIVGANTHFAAGSTTADFGAGITVNSLTVNSATSATANITVQSNAVPGSRTVTLTTGTEGASLTGGFTVAPAQVVVPNVVGLTQAAATTAITGAGLVLGTVTTASSNTVPAGNVISESPVAGTMVNTGSAVNLVVSSGAAPTVVSFNVLFGSQSYNVTTSTRTRLPWNIAGFQVVFSKPIVSGSAASLGGATVTGFTGLGTNILTWSINAVANANLDIVLSGSGANALKDAAGNALTDGAGYSQILKILWGDFNDDGLVSAADLVAVNNATVAPYNIVADMNGDGIVNTLDVQIVRTRVGTSLP
jgi:hypothetical protein